MRHSERPNQDTIFIPYVQSLCKELTARGFSCRRIETVSIKKATIDKKLAGSYYPIAHEILISKVVWDKSSDAVREQLIFHELGHSLGLDHNIYGIMQSAGFIKDDFYQEHRQAFINAMLDDMHNKTEEKAVTNEVKLGSDKNVTKEDILENEHAVVRFTATWCPPCKALAPIFEEVAAANPDIKVYVIDVDQVQGLAGEFGIRGIPALVKIKGNKVETTLVGMQSKEKIEELFK
jgi:thioredoxin 1